MSVKQFNTRIALKTDVTENWSNSNPVLMRGEFGWNESKKNFKIGDGKQEWNTLPYLLPTFGNSFAVEVTDGLTEYQVNVDGTSIQIGTDGKLKAVGATLGKSLTIGTGDSAVTFDGSAAAGIKAGTTLKETISTNTVTFDHGDVTTTTNAGTEQTPGFGQQFDIPAITVGTNGHVTNNGVAKVTLPSETTVTIGNATSGTAALTFEYTAITSLEAANHTITPTTQKFTVPTTITVAEATSAVDSQLPTEKAVRTAIDEAVAGKNVDADGDDYVEADAADNKVSVKASASTIASLAKADTALQSVSATGDAYITANFGDKTASNTQALTVTLGNTQNATNTTTYTNTNLALAAYVDEKVAGAIAGGVQYKGTITDTLPSNPANGDMYKTTAKSAAGSSVNWKTGDVVIYHQEETSTGGWDVIPAGDDVEYTGIKVGETTVIPATTGGDATFAAGHTSGETDLITVAADGTSHTVTYKSTEALETAVANANSAIQSVDGEQALTTTNYVAVTASTSNNEVTLSSSITDAVITDALEVTTPGIVTSGSIANIMSYVDALGTTSVSSTDDAAGITATLDGTVGDPTIALTVTEGSIEADDTSVVTGGTVYTAIAGAKTASEVAFASTAASNDTAAISTTQGGQNKGTVTLTGSDTIGITGDANKPTFAVKDNSIGAQEIKEYECFIFNCGSASTNTTEAGYGFASKAVPAQAQAQA